MSQERQPGRPPVKVFIVHSDVDLEFARSLRNLLVQRLQAHVVTTDDVNVRDRLEPELRKELSSADLLVAVLTPSAIHSNYVLHEVGAAWALRKSIVSVVTRRDVLNEMPVSLESGRIVQLADLESQESANKLLDAIEESLAAAPLR